MSVQWCIAICNVVFFNNFPSLSFLCASTIILHLLSIILHLPSTIERYYLLFSIRIYKEQVREEVSSQYIKFIFLFSTMNKFKKSILVEEILKSSSSFSSDEYETTMTQMMAYHFSMLEIELGQNFILFSNLGHFFGMAQAILPSSNLL